MHENLSLIRYLSQFLFIFLILDDGNTSLTKTYQLCWNWCTLVIFVNIMLHTYCDIILSLFSFTLSILLYLLLIDYMHFIYTARYVHFIPYNKLILKKVWVSENILAQCASGFLGMENVQSCCKLANTVI